MNSIVVGPKQVFKHAILGQLLRGMQRKFQNGFTYTDFSPGPGHAAPIDQGLKLLLMNGNTAAQLHHQ